MRENRKIIICTALASILALISAISIENKYYINVSYLLSYITNHREFCVNIFIGIFCSALLGCIISLLSYYAMKKRLLNEYWCLVQKHLQEINIFGTIYFKKGKSIEEIIKKIIMSDEFAKDVNRIQSNYINISYLVSEIKLLNKKSELYKLILEISEISGKVNLEFTDLNKIHFNSVDYQVAVTIINKFNKDNSIIDQLKLLSEHLQKIIGVKVSFE